MPGVAKRDRKGNAEPENKAEIKVEDVAAKIGKEAITAQEMAVFLEAQKPDITMSDKTVKNHIKDICKKSEGMLSEEDFKRGRKFVFESHYQGLLLSLLDTSAFDDRKNDRKLATKSKLNTELAENVNKYLTGEDSELVRESPIYITVRLEDELFKRINQETAAIIRDSYHTDAAVRWKSLQEYLDALKKVRLAVQHRYSDSFAKRMVYAHEFDDREDAFYQQGLFKAETMEDLLIALLACRIHGKTKNIGLSPNGGFLALKLAADVFRGKTFEDERLKKLIDGLNKDINSAERYKKIDEKAKQILDLSDPYEKNIYEMLMYYTHLTFLVDYADPKEYQGMQRYMEGIAKYDAFDVLRKFLTM